MLHQGYLHTIYQIYYFRELHPDKADDLQNFKQHLVDASNDLTPLKVWEIQGKHLIQIIGKLIL